jgi:hypothetical protein
MTTLTRLVGAAQTGASEAGLPRGRPDPTVVALLALPFLLLAADPLWPYGSLYRDAWVYFGFFQNLPGYLRAFPEYYGTGRLTVLLPGWAAYSLLPPLTANLVLHFSLFYTAVFSAYFALGHTVGRRAGFLAAVLMGGHPFFLKAVGWDYVDGYAIAYCLLAHALLVQAARSRWWKGWVFAAGAAAGAVGVANIGLVLLLAPLPLFFIAASRGRERLPLDAAGFWFAAGGLALVVGLGLINRALGGPFLFLLSSLAFAQNYTPGTARLYSFPISEWGARAAWLVFPAAAAVGAVVWLLRWPFRRYPGGATAYFQGQLLALVAVQAVMQCQGHSYLQSWFYASVTLAVPGFCALSGQWARRLDELTPAQFRALAAVACGVAVLSGLPVERMRTPGGAPVWLAVALGCGVAGALLPLLRGTGLRAAVAAVVLLGAANLLARAQFRMADSMPGVAGILRLDACEDLGRHRKAVFLAAYDTARWVRQLGPPEQVWFWYDLREPLGPAYDLAAHTNGTYYRVVSWSFPEVAGGKTCDGHAVGHIPAGDTVVVLSARPLADADAARVLRSHGLNAHVVGTHLLGRRAPVFLPAIVFRVLPPGEMPPDP